MDIYAIGHSNYSFETFVSMLNEYKINCVVDIRAIPYSKYNTQYNKEQFQNNLKKLGFVYIFMAEEFGAKRNSRESYNKEGYANFEKVIKEEIFKRGIDRLKKGCSMGYKIAILGAMQEPNRCPRSILIGRQLVKENFNVKYIMHEGNLQTQEDIEESLLDKYFDFRNQMTIDNLLGNAMTKEEMIEVSYRLANEEIGYRIENLPK